MLGEFGLPRFVLCDRKASFVKMDEFEKAKVEVEDRYRTIFRFVAPSAHFASELVKRRMKQVHDVTGKLDMKGTCLENHRNNFCHLMRTSLKKTLHKELDSSEQVEPQNNEYADQELVKSHANKAVDLEMRRTWIFEDHVKMKNASLTPF